MAPLPEDDDTSSLEKARERLYAPDAALRDSRISLAPPGERTVRHAWEEDPIKRVMPGKHRHVRLAGIFFGAALAFFLVSLGVAGYFFYYGGNSVSVNKIAITIQGPTTVAGGDTVPLSFSITNKNPVALDNATIEIDFPDGTRSADDVTQAYPRYTETLGTLASGATVTRSLKAVVFGGAGQTLALPVSFSYGTAGSNAVFVKKSSYALAISSTPLSVSVDTLAETVSGQPFTINLTVRSNATVPLSNVVLASTFPFGFSVTSSSVPLNGANFFIGTLAPGASKAISLTGTLTGQNNEQRVFHFTVGTGNSSTDPSPTVTYMTQDASVAITAPFINTTLTLNSQPPSTAVVSAGTRQSVTLSYTNTLATNVTNATIGVTLSGSAVDYNSIQSTNGFYRSSDHTILFSPDTDPSLVALAPNASGIGTFTFTTLPASANVRSPQITFTISVSGTRVGQSNVPEQVTASATETTKVATAVTLSASALHTSGPFPNTGPIPPHSNQATTYTIAWNATDSGSAIAGAIVSAVLPSYVTFANKTSGDGSILYDPTSRTVSWNIGDLAQGQSTQAAFQVSFTPSTSQSGSTPALTSAASFSGYDRFAGIQVSATADPVTTETKNDPGYVPANANVQ